MNANVKDNKTVLKGKNVNFVPYLEAHVLQYHEWMKDLQLQELTASEPLSLEEEYEMQISWAQDCKKFTFIIHCPLEESHSSSLGPKKLRERFGAMIGDCNLYWNIDEEPNTAEIELMIAEVGYRRKGFGQETLLIFMKYATSMLGVTKFIAKISMNNFPSLALFKKLGFIVISTSAIFQEETLEIAASALNLLTQDVDYKLDSL